MLEVDVEGNQILLTEPLATQDTDNSNGREDSDPQTPTPGRGIVFSYHVFANFLAGLLTLIILAIAVSLASRRTIVQCTGISDDGNGPSGNPMKGVYATWSIAENIQDCNTTIGVDKFEHNSSYQTL